MFGGLEEKDVHALAIMDESVHADDGGAKQDAEQYTTGAQTSAHAGRTSDFSQRQ